MRKPSWYVTRFDAYVDDDDGRWKIHLDGRHRIGRIRMTDRASEAEILRALTRAGLVDFEHRRDVHFDWLSDASFNIVAGDEPIYQVVRGMH